MRRALALVATCAVALLGLAAPAGAAQLRPFSGTVRGTSTFPSVSTSVCPAGGPYVGGVQTVSLAQGVATHLGRTTLSAKHCTPTGAITGGKETLTAANGDQIFADYGGPCVFNPATAVVGVTPVVCQTPFVITGGTGRFAHASGHADMQAVLTFMGMGPQPWPGTWTWHGVISY